MTKEQIYREALERIANCNQRSLEGYCAVVDAIAVEALVRADALEDEQAKPS